jgi:hypothetical protein
MHILKSALLACALATSALASADTSEDIAAIAARASEHRVLLVGEIHGTAEVALAVGDLAAQLAQPQQPLIVALEIWHNEQPRIDRFLDSAGTDSDRAELLAGEFWSREYQDGRSSLAMFDLLERLRTLKLKTELDVLAFDQSPADARDDSARDREMADRISAALKAQPLAQALVLAGNFHTRIQDGAPWDASHRFMGYHLIEYQPYSLEIMGVKGSAWICTGSDVDSCKARDMPENPQSPGLVLGNEIGDRGHHGIWWLPQVTASPPATTAEHSTFPAFP